MNPIFVKSFLTPLEAEALLASVQCLPWTRGQFRGHPVPREEVWIGPYAYKFSGRTLEPAGWTAEIAAIRDKIQAQYGGDYNSVLLNRYANARDSVSWHSDDEPEMDSAHLIASLSLGASRAFLVRPITHKNSVQTYVLTSESLLVMPAGFQQKYQHCVPKSKIACGTRVNLTFRRMKLAEDEGF
ncbi:MAG: alpha-ketoglutarate-dependent dioxygenase AlkB [Acidobacteria bacterium]|jgi:alkylated DNA repair dioxygenase AlkB|nr:MAG: alpha-ketoglutarate-dependent dioxygenase AlkB [Acidobacteriota bacterium]